MKIKVNSKVNYAVLKSINEKSKKCLVKTADAIRTDLINSQTMPFDEGTLQNKSTFVDDSKATTGRVRIVSDTPYARRLYFHPEYRFDKSKNPNAGGKWFAKYIDGEKKGFVTATFAKFMRGRKNGT